MIPFNDMRGTETICDLGASELRGAGVSVNLTSIDECLTNVRFLLTGIDDVSFVCADDDLSPMLAGETTIGNTNYSYYSCCE